MKNIIIILCCLFTFVSFASSCHVAAGAPVEVKTIKLIDAANHYQEMIAEKPDYVYIDDEFKDGELNIGLKMMMTSNGDDNQVNWVDDEEFTDIKGQKFGCVKGGQCGFPLNGKVIGTDVVALELLGERPLVMYLVFGGRASASKLTPTILGNFFKKAYLSPVCWSIPLGSYRIPGSKSFKLNIIPGNTYTIDKHSEVSENFINYEFIIDRLSLECNEPFGLVIADDETGKVLFMGAINEMPKWR